MDREHNKGWDTSQRAAAHSENGEISKKQEVLTTMRRKLLAWLLIVCMMVGLMPATAFSALAAEEPAASNTPVVTLGDAVWTTDEAAKTFTYPNATVDYTGDIYLLTVTSNKPNTVPKTITVDGNTETSYLSDLKGQSATWLYTTPKSAAEVQKRIRALNLTWADGMQVEVTVDGNKLVGFDNIQDSNAKMTKFGDHYYMYVPYNGTEMSSWEARTWNKAYNRAKGYVLGGMQGYLTAITSKDEFNHLRSVLGTGDAWCGGTAITTESSGAVMNDPKQITDEQAASFYYRQIGGKTLPAATGDPDTYYYWACGPEHGSTVITNISDICDFDQGPTSVPQDAPNPIDGANKNLWHDFGVYKIVENTCEIRLSGEGETASAVINDIAVNYGTGYDDHAPMLGFFVEFGGYAEGEDPGKKNDALVTSDTSDQKPDDVEASITTADEKGLYTSVEKGLVALQGKPAGSTLQLEKADVTATTAPQTLKAGYSVKSFDQNTTWTANGEDATVSVAANGGMTLNTGALDVTVAEGGTASTIVDGYAVSGTANHKVTQSDAASPFEGGASITATAAEQTLSAQKDGKSYTYESTEANQPFYLGEFSVKLNPENGSHATLTPRSTEGEPQNPYYLNDYTFTVTPEDNYELNGNAMKVKMGDEVLGDGEYTLTKAGDTAYEITVPKVTGNLVVDLTYDENTPNEDRPVVRQMTEITVKGLEGGTYTATSADDGNQTIYKPDENDVIKVPRNAETKLVFTPSGDNKQEFALLTSLKGEDNAELFDGMKDSFNWDAYSYTYTYEPSDEKDSFTAVYTPAHLVDAAVTNGNATFETNTVLESKGEGTGEEPTNSWTGQALVANNAEAKLTFTTDAKNVYHRAWIVDGENKTPVEDFDGQSYTFPASESYTKLDVEFHPGWTITVNTKNTELDTTEGDWQGTDDAHTLLVGPDSDLTLRFTPNEKKTLQSVTLDDKEIALDTLERDGDAYLYTLEKIDANKTFEIKSDSKYTVLFYTDSSFEHQIGKPVTVANNGKLTKTVLDEKQSQLDVPEGKVFYAWQDEYGTYYNANTIVEEPSTRLYPVYHDGAVTGEDGTVIAADSFRISVSSLDAEGLTADLAKKLANVEALKADGTAASLEEISVSGDGIGKTEKGKFSVTFTYGEATIEVQAELIDTKPEVTGKTAHTLTFKGEPNTAYTITKVADSTPATPVTTDKDGKGMAKGLEKNTEYTIASELFGAANGKTLSVDAYEIAKAFEETNKGDTQSNNATDETEKAWNSNVEVTVGADGNYKVTVKQTIDGQTITVPNTWGDVTLDLNGKDIIGPDATPTTPAGPGMNFSNAGGEGTDLTIVGPGTIQGGNGLQPYPNGAPGVKGDEGANSNITVSGGATIQGGNGANGSAEAPNGGNGGAGVEGGDLGVTVDGGTITGGNGGNGADNSNPAANGGNGGAGIETDDDVIVNDGTVSGGNGGNGGNITGGSEDSTAGSGGNGGEGIIVPGAPDGDGSITIDPDGTVNGGNGGNGGANDNGTGGNGGTGGTGTDGDTDNSGTINGGNGGNGGSSDKGEGGNGGQGGSGTDGNTNNKDDGTINGGNGGNGGTSEEGNGGNGDTDNSGDINGGNGGNGGGSEEGNGGTGGNGGEGTDGNTDNKDDGNINGGNGGDGGDSNKGEGGNGDGTTDENGDGNINGGNGGNGGDGEKPGNGGNGGDGSGTGNGGNEGNTGDENNNGGNTGGGGGGITPPDKPDEPDEPEDGGIADPDDTGVSDLLNTTDHNAYMGGYEDGTFGPSRSITRAEVASAFHRLLLDKDTDMDKTFSDVAEDSWYYETVTALASMGLIGGYEDGTFRPDQAITRAEFAAMATRFAKPSDAKKVTFTDVDKDSWYYDAVRTAVSYGWIGGYEDGTFRPEQKISRAEAIAIMNRMLARIADHSAIDDGAGTRFVDVAENHWAFYDITEAATAHDYSRPSNSDEEHWK